MNTMNTTKPLIGDDEIDNCVMNAISINKMVRMAIGKKDYKTSATTIFIKRFGQQVKLAFRNPKLSKAILDIREELDIPKNGFAIDYNSDFFKWIKDHKELKYSKILYVINKYPIIKTDPTALLDDLLSYEEIENHKDIETFKNGIISNNYPKLDIYINHIIEKPFTGIFEFILFNKLMIPSTNGIATLARDLDKFIVLAVSVNTTKRDLLELWTEIDWQQKNFNDSSKSKIRFKPKLEEDMKIFDIAAEKEREIKEMGLIGKEAIHERNKSAYNTIDEVFGEEEIMSKSSDLKKLARRRKKIGRIKKLVGPT